MLFPKRLIIVLLLVGIFVVSVWSQAYLPDLKNEDLNAIDQKLKSLGTSYKNEPLVGVYLTVGKNPEFLGKLLEKGANPNRKAPNQAWSPLTYAIMQDLSPEIVARLLQAGALLESTVAGTQGNIIDVALSKQELQNASLLVKANQRRTKATRLVPSAEFKDYSAFFLDDLIEVRGALRYSDLTNVQVWNLALAGNSRKVLKYIMDFQINPNFNAPGKSYENSAGNDLLAANLDLLKYLLSDGLAPDQVNFDQLYQRLFATKNVDSVRALRALDPAVHPGLYKKALAVSPEFLRALTNNLDDLSQPALYDPTSFSSLLFGEGNPEPSSDPPLLILLFEKFDLATVARVLKVNQSETGLLSLYRYAFAHKKLDILKMLLSGDPKPVRPELYSTALDVGMDWLMAITHNGADLKNSGLYADANQNNGRDHLLAVLFKPAASGRTLLESIFEKTDLATILPIIQALNPPAELLTGKVFTASYTAWINRDNKDIVAFGFVVPAVQGTIQGTQISVVVPAGVDVTALAAQFTLTGGVATIGNVPQVSGETANDFTAPVLYTVTAQDSSKKTYTVIVNAAPMADQNDTEGVLP